MPIYDLAYNPDGADTPGAGAPVFVEICRWNDGGYSTAGQAIFQTGPSKDFVLATPSVAAANAPAWATAPGGQGSQTGTYRLALFANGTTTTPLASLTGAITKPWGGSGVIAGTFRLDDPNTAASGFDSPYTDMSNAFDTYGVANSSASNYPPSGRVWKLFMSTAVAVNGKWTVRAADGSAPATTANDGGYNQSAEPADSTENNYRLEYATTVYTTQATWNGATSQNGSATAMLAEYVGNGTGSTNNSMCANPTPASGSIPTHTGVSGQQIAGNWRIRFTPTTGTELVTAANNLYLSFSFSGLVDCFQIGTSSTDHSIMIDAFGTAGFAAAGIWTLERQTSTVGFNLTRKNALATGKYKLSWNTNLTPNAWQLVQKT